MVAYFAYITPVTRSTPTYKYWLLHPSDEQGNDQLFFHLLNTDMVHAKRQHDDVFCKKYILDRVIY
jgi:hypothetical protein